MDTPFRGNVHDGLCPDGTFDFGDTRTLVLPDRYDVVPCLLRQRRWHGLRSRLDAHKLSS